MVKYSNGKGLRVREYVGKAHGIRFLDNRLQISYSDSSDTLGMKLPIRILVEEGKHASVPDFNGDGVYSPGQDVNIRPEDAWGLRDNIRFNYLGPPSYRAWMSKQRQLLSNDGRRDLFEPIRHFDVVRIPDPGTSIAPYIEEQKKKDALLTADDFNTKDEFCRELLAATNRNVRSRLWPAEDLPEILISRKEKVWRKLPKEKQSDLASDCNTHLTHDLLNEYVIRDKTAASTVVNREEFDSAFSPYVRRFDWNYYTKWGNRIRFPLGMTMGGAVLNLLHQAVTDRKEDYVSAGIFTYGPAAIWVILDSFDIMVAKSSIPSWRVLERKVGERKFREKQKLSYSERLFTSSLGYRFDEAAYIGMIPFHIPTVGGWILWRQLLDKDVLRRPRSHNAAHPLKNQIIYARSAARITGWYFGYTWRNYFKPPSSESLELGLRSRIPIPTPWFFTFWGARVGIQANIDGRQLKDPRLVFELGTGAY